MPGGARIGVFGGSFDPVHVGHLIVAEVLRHALALERDSIIFMPLHWVIVHPITASSPLRGFTRESLVASDPEIYCMITADDETFAQTVHARTSYDETEIVWGSDGLAVGDQGPFLSRL